MDVQDGLSVPPIGLRRSAGRLIVRRVYSIRLQRSENKSTSVDHVGEKRQDFREFPPNL